MTKYKKNRRTYSSDWISLLKVLGIYIAALALITGCGADKRASHDSVTGPPLTSLPGYQKAPGEPTQRPPEMNESKYLAVHPTVYYIPSINTLENQCPKKPLVSIYSAEGVQITQLCPEAYSACLMESVCRIETPRETFTLSYVKKKKGQAIFRKVDTTRCPLGFGVKNACLDPFYTIAADLRYHSPGEVIFIPQVRGLTLPDQTRHSGYFIVRDTGSRKFISGPGRFDFFTEEYSPKNNDYLIFKYLTGSKKHPMTFLSVSRHRPELASEFLKVRNYPELPER